MNEWEKTLEMVEEQEKTLLFDSFDSTVALEIGLMLVDRAKAEKLAVTIDITKGGQQMFHYSFDGTSPDNDSWVRRKNAVVYRFNMSSYCFGLRLKIKGETMEDRYAISPAEYTVYGGAFPVHVCNVGVVGTVTVSGLTEEEDHDLAVWAIREYLYKQKA